MFLEKPKNKTEEDQISLWDCSVSKPIFGMLFADWNMWYEMVMGVGSK